MNSPHLRLAYPHPAIARAERDARIARARRLTRNVGADALLTGAGDKPRYLTGVGRSLSGWVVALLLP